MLFGAFLSERKHVYSHGPHPVFSSCALMFLSNTLCFICFIFDLYIRQFLFNSKSFSSQYSTSPTIPVSPLFIRCRPFHRSLSICLSLSLSIYLSPSLPLPLPLPPLSPSLPLSLVDCFVFVYPFLFFTIQVLIPDRKCSNLYLQFR